MGACDQMTVAARVWGLRMATAKAARSVLAAGVILAGLVLTAPPTAWADDLERALGPLADVTLGPDGNWTYGLEGGWFTMTNNQAPQSARIQYNRTDDTQGVRTYGVRMAFQRIAGDERIGMGLVYDVSEDGSFWRAVTISEGGDMVLITSEDFSFESEVVPITAPFANDGSDFLRLVDQGNGEITVYLNENEIHARTHDAPTSAGFGIGALGPGRFAFSDLTVEHAATAPSPGPVSRVPQPEPEGPPLEIEGSLDPALTAYQTRRGAMIIGSMMGVLFHEMGHAMIGELGLPSTGPEEDAADEFSALAMASVAQPEVLDELPEVERQFLLDMVRYATLLWHYDGIRTNRAGLRIPWYDEHAPSEIRFRNSLCMVYGSNPKLFAGIADEVGFPERSRERCESDFTRRMAAWDQLTEMFEHDPEADADTPRGIVRVVFHESRNETGQNLLPFFRENGIIDGLAELFSDYFHWPRNLTVLFMDCGVANAFYDPQYGRVIMCWEGIEYFARIVLEHEGALDPNVPPPT